jgi:hypothetical protein
VLRFKGEPMRVADIHAACEELLRLVPVSKV